MQNVINLLNETINGMSKMEYAQAIAKAVNGTVNEVDKANGTRKIGICIGEGNVRPNIYIDEMFNDNLTVEQATEKIRDIYKQVKVDAPEINVDNVVNYEETKGKLRLRLYHKDTKAEVFQSAKKYGFDDLILVPYIELGKSGDNLMSIKVSKKLLENWGITKVKCINQALKNSKEFDGYKVKSMRDTMIELMGEEAVSMLPPDEVGMTTITNTDKHFGALGAIVCAKELSERFKDGYFIIPSSIHEVIAVPRVGADAEGLAQMIKEVNEGQVAPEERLSDHAYEFEGVA